VPASDRRRTYDATVTAPREANYVVTLTSGTFFRHQLCGIWSGLGCNQFTAARDGDVIRFDLVVFDDEFGGHIVEQLSSGAWMSIAGSTVGRPEGTSIDAKGSSRIYYCPVQPPGTPCCAVPTPPGVPCEDLSVGCTSSDMTLKLTRR
jgi:hypothetical protein